MTEIWNMQWKYSKVYKIFFQNELIVPSNRCVRMALSLPKMMAPIWPPTDKPTTSSMKLVIVSICLLKWRQTGCFHSHKDKRTHQTQTLASSCSVLRLTAQRFANSSRCIWANRSACFGRVSVCKVKIKQRPKLKC